MARVNKRISHYILKKEIGKGGFGSVYLGEDLETNEKCAVKIIKDNSNVQIDREIKIMRDLKHENIIKLYNDVKKDGEIYIFLEYCGGGDLDQKIRQTGGMKESVARYYLKQLAEALNYLNKNRIIHRDLKPANILLTRDGQVKLADFGLARILDAESMAKTILGTLPYMAPEVTEKLRKRDLDEKYDLRADIWSIGCIVYELIRGKRLFQETDQHDLEQKIKQAVTTKYFLSEGLFSDVCINFLSNIIAPVEKRMKFNTFYQHPFVTGLPGIKRSLRLVGETNQEEELKNERKNIRNNAINFSKAVQQLENYKVSELLDFKACQLIKGIGPSYETNIRFRDHFLKIRFLNFEKITSAKIVEDIVLTVIKVIEDSKDKHGGHKELFRLALDLLEPLKLNYLIIKLQRALRSHLEINN